MPAALPKTNELMDRIVDLPDGGGGNTFEIQRLKSDIGKLLKVEAASSYMLEGILYAKLRDAAASRNAHERSVRLSVSASKLWNYSASMASLAHYAEARDQVARLLALGYTQSHYVKSLLWLSLVTLDFSGFDQSYQRYAHLADDAGHQGTVGHMKLHADTIADFVAAFPEVRPDLDRLYFHVQSVLEDEQTSISIHWLNVKEDNFMGQRVLHLDYSIEAEVDSVIRLNEALLNKVSMDDSLEHWDSVIASFVPSQPDDEQQGAIGYASNA